MSVGYKYKPDKHKFVVNVKTIDEMHKEYMNEFKKNHDSLPEKKNELEKLKSELSDLDNNDGGKPINLDLDLLKKRNTLKKKIDEIQNSIESIESYNNEMQYYSRTGNIIYDYYNLTNGILYGQDFENKDEPIKTDTKGKKRISEEDDDDDKISKIKISDELLAITNSNRTRKLKKPVRKRNKKISTTPTKNIMSFLLKDDEPVVDEKNAVQCKATLQNEYLMMMDKEYACSKSKPSFAKKCKNPKCANQDKIVIYNESIITCPKCGEVDLVYMESDAPTHKESFNDKPKYPYKRKGHCVEKLNQFLCKGTANIPSEVFAILEEETTKHGIERKDITVKFIESMLKKHRMSSYYEYTMFIYSKMTNTPPQTITRDEYELVLKMFDEANEVYEKKFKPKARSNFLKYTFVLNKIFITIGKQDIAKHFKLLKSPVKMKEQEKIWKSICEDLGWDK